MSEEEAVRVGEAFTRSLELLPGERVLRESRVNRERLFMDVLGLLYLTNQRLIFLPYLYTLSWSPVIVDLTAVESFGSATLPWYRSISNLFTSTSWYVKVRKRIHVFSSMSGSEDRDSWLTAVSSVANVPIGRPRAF